MPSRVRYEHHEAGWEQALGSAAMLRAIHRKGEKVQTRAEQIANRDTGRYAGDIDVPQPAGFYTHTFLRSGRAVSRVQNDVPYSRWLEFGTRYMRRYRILGRALDAAKEP